MQVIKKGMNQEFLEKRNAAISRIKEGEGTLNDYELSGRFIELETINIKVSELGRFMQDIRYYELHGLKSNILPQEIQEHLQRIHHLDYSILRSSLNIQISGIYLYATTYLIPNGKEFNVLQLKINILEG